jgi:hypothetical protein
MEYRYIHHVPTHHPLQPLTVVSEEISLKTKHQDFDVYANIENTGKRKQINTQIDEYVIGVTSEIFNSSGGDQIFLPHAFASIIGMHDAFPVFETMAYIHSSRYELISSPDEFFKLVTGDDFTRKHIESESFKSIGVEYSNLDAIKGYLANGILNITIIVLRPGFNKAGESAKALLKRRKEKTMCDAEVYLIVESLV